VTAGTTVHDAAGDRILQAGEVRLARLESLRALAALAVLVGHVWVGVHIGSTAGIFATFWRRALLNGGMGVFVFFALSGYLLFSPFVRRHFSAGPEPGRPLDLRSYARNRALRILPLYFAAIVVLMVLGGHAGDGTLWVRHLLFVQSMWEDSLNVLDGPLWSVAVEIQFYVLLPLIAIALAVLSRRSKAVAAALLVAVGLLSAVARWKLATHAANPRNPWAYQLPTTFVYFTGGMVLALLRQGLVERGARIPRGILGSAGAWALLAVGGWLLATWHLDQDVWLAPAGFLLVGALVLPLRRGRWADLLDWRPLAIVGVASYSLYVWHVPLGNWLDWGGSVLEPFVIALAGVAVLAVVVALVSYRLIEVPALRLRRQWSSSRAADG
jgi:peptidoglycan/LPS O-acetylase OafA/YrhL